MSRLTGVITGGGDQRDVSLDALCQGVPLDALLAECRALDNFRRSCDNLYERVRALFFLYEMCIRDRLKVADQRPSLHPLCRHNAETPRQS